MDKFIGLAIQVESHDGKKIEGVVEGIDLGPRFIQIDFILLFNFKTKLNLKVVQNYPPNYSG